MFARTPRLTLRPGWPEDAAALTQAIAHESVVTRLSRAPWPYAIDDARDFLERPRHAGDATLLILANHGVDDGDDDGKRPELVGCIGVHPEQDWHELGYWLTPAAWGRGYATEAGRQMIEIARWSLGLTRLRAGHFADNPGSGRVMQKLGFRPTGDVVPQFCRALGRDMASVRHELDLTAMPLGAMPLAA